MIDESKLIEKEKSATSLSKVTEKPKTMSFKETFSLSQVLYTTTTSSNKI